MKNLKTYKSILLFSLMIFVLSILANIISSSFIILTKLPPYLSSYIQYLIVIPLYIILNVKISKQHINILPTHKIKNIIMPGIILIISTIILLRPNSFNSNIKINNVFLYEIAFCIGSATSEEYFARGILLKALLKINENKGKLGLIISIVLSSLIFSAFHLLVAIISKSFIEMIVTFLLGLILCSLYIATKSLIPGMYLHFIYNFTVYFLNNNLAGVHISEYTVICIIISILILFPVMLEKKNKKF